MADELPTTPAPQQQAPLPAAQSLPQPAADIQNLMTPDGDLVGVHDSQVPQALESGYQRATPEQVNDFAKEQKYGSLSEQLKTASEGAAEAATFGLSTGAEKMAGANPEDIRGRRETNPVAHMLGQGAGLVGSAFVGTGEAKALGAAGEAATKLLGIANAESNIAKIGSAAVKGAVENGLFQAGDEVSKLLSGDPSQSAETAVADVGLASLLGGGIGGAAGSVSPLWDATVGNKVGGMLKTITDKLGGVEGHIPDNVDAAIAQSGMTIAPEVRAGLSSDPEVQQMFKTLQQSDTTKSGLALQEADKAFRKDASEAMSKTLGRELSEVPEKGEISRYEAGKSLGNTLAKEYQESMSPIAKEFDAIRDKYGKTDLIPDQLNPPGSDIPAIPGTTSRVLEEIGSLANREGWTTSPSSEIMQEVNRIFEELPKQKTVKNLSDYIKQVGANMQSDPLNGSMLRAGGQIKSILKNAEADVIGQRLGEKEGMEAAKRFRDARSAYSAQSDIRDAIDSRLHAKGSTSGYAKSIREMASTDGEAVINRLSGKNDADLLKFLGDNFPRTAQKLKEYHIDNLLSSAKEGDALKPEKLLKNLKALSPEMRSFVADPASLNKINAIGTILNKINELPHNFSNTARTVDKLLQYVPGSAIGLVAMLTGHSPVTGAILGYLTKSLGKSVPDAARLSLLKFLGSSEPISAPAFKAMADHIQSTINGENVLSRATKNLFKAGKEVLPEGYMPSDAKVEKLNKTLLKMRTDQDGLLKVADGVNHYMPEHGAAMGQTAANAVNYLNQLRPNKDPANPLDSKKIVSAPEKAQFNQALKIAESPLSVLPKIKDGTLTPADVVHLKSLYPALYQRIAEKLTYETADAKSKDMTIPYKTRISMAMFLAQPMDSTMTPEAIQSAQPQPQPLPQQGSMGKPKRGTATLGKLHNSYMTQNQSAEADRAKRS